MIDGGAARPLDAPARCRRCGAIQESVPEGKSLCPACDRRLRLARPPVPRGPVGLCEHHPDRPVTGVCAACGAFTCVTCDVSLRGIRYCERCREEQARRIQVPIPWDERRIIGWGRAWWRTTAAITTRPGEFFSHMDPRGSLGSAVLFGLIGVLLANSFAILIMLLETGVMGVLMGVTSAFASGQPPQGGGPHPVLIVVGMTLYMLALTMMLPLSGMIGYTVMTSLMHGTLRLFGAGGEHGLRATIKVACYAMGTGWVGIVPYMGQMIQPFWWTGLMVLGTARVHDCSTTRSLSILIPMGAACVAPIAAYVVFFVVGIVLGFL